MDAIDKAFIIDDEEAICLLLSGLLKREGIETNFNTSLAGSVEKAKDFDPDVIFLDLSLGDGSGFSIIPDLREKLPDSEIILISAHDGQAERDNAKELNVKYFIPKPLNRDLIFETLREI